MTDIATIQKKLPQLSGMLQRIADTFDEVETFQDLERVFLRGQGLSPGTYRVYLGAVREFYDWSDGLHPFQWTPQHIEMFYDHVRERVSVNAAYVKVAALKNFCSQVVKQFPFVESPFSRMSDALIKKLNQSGRSRKKKALYRSEIRGMLDYLESQDSLKADQTRAMIVTMLSTGLRIAETCALTLEALEFNTDTRTWYVQGVGKGSKPFYVELPVEARDAIFQQFERQFGRPPRPSEHLFHTLESYPGKPVTPMKPATFWRRLSQLGSELKQQGIIRSDIEFSAHLFRRSFMTHMAQLGMSVADLQRAGRHSSFDTSLKHYIEAQGATQSYVTMMLSGLSGPVGESQGVANGVR